jgi:hypothetical protein
MGTTDQRRDKSVVKDIGGGFVMDDYVMAKDMAKRQG